LALAITWCYRAAPAVRSVNKASVAQLHGAFALSVAPEPPHFGQFITVDGRRVEPNGGGRGPAAQTQPPPLSATLALDTVSAAPGPLRAGSPLLLLARSAGTRLLRGSNLSGLAHCIWLEGALFSQ
jgi:hypothetical protein